MHGWQANKKGTCALPVEFRAMPENAKPPAMRVNIYYWIYAISKPASQLAFWLGFTKYGKAIAFMGDCSSSAKITTMSNF